MIVCIWISNYEDISRLNGRYAHLLLSCAGSLQIQFPLTKATLLIFLAKLVVQAIHFEQLWTSIATNV